MILNGWAEISQKIAGAGHRRYGIGLGAVLGLAGLLCGAVQAQDSPTTSADAPLTPSTGPRPLWEVGLAGGVGSYSDYPASDRYRVRGLPIPYFIYRGGVFRSDAGGPRLHAATGRVEFEFSGAGALSSSSSSGPRQGMPDLDYLLELGPNAKITVVRPTPDARLLVDVPVRAAFSTNFSHFDWRGIVLAPDVAYEDEHLFGGRWGGRLSLGADFATARLQDYFYQVAPQYALPGRPAYDAHGGYLGSHLLLSVYRPLTPHFNLFLSGQFDLYSGAENSASPLFKSSTGFGGIIGFAWSVWQSKRFEQTVR